MKRIKILVAEDDRTTQHLLKKNLSKWGYEVVVCSDGDTAWKILQKKNHPKLLILDWVMPGKQGIEICRMIREKMKGPYIYIVLLTAKTRIEEIIQGLEAGADDYITKPFDIHELKMRLYIGARIITLQKQLLSMNKELRKQVNHDSLTGLWNHRAILNILKREINRSMRGRIPVGIIMADLDHFKKINDSYGHPVGDKVLVEVAKRFKKLVRAYDYVGRYGGEEFLMILPDCVEENLKNITERFCSCIRKESIPIKSQNIFLTISVGATLGGFLTNEIGLSTVIQTADEALYKAKNAGRNRSVVKI